MAEWTRRILIVHMLEGNVDLLGPDPTTLPAVSPVIPTTYSSRLSVSLDLQDKPWAFMLCSLNVVSLAFHPPGQLFSTR
jgi:hypothetical protein